MKKNEKKLNGKPRFSIPEGILCTLSPEEMASVSAIDKMIADAVELMERGRNDLWRCITDKYKLPKVFNYNSQTGEVSVND